MINIRETLAEAKYYRGLRRKWRSAKDVPSLGRLGARWAEGVLGAHPSGYDVPDMETTTLLPVLGRANAAGFFTYQSQPGGAWDTQEGHVEQRAFVQGFLERAELDRFRSYLEGAGMLVLDSMTHDEPLVRYDGDECSGGTWRARSEGDMNHISSAAQHALTDAADLDVIDTVWGRNDALWNALDAWAASHA
jgi:hypothetical protein